MGTETKKRRSLRERLWAEDPHCYWCGVVTILFAESRGPIPPTLATVDHIRSRLSPRRSLPAQGLQWAKGIRVLACHRCNNLRGKYEQAFFRAVDPKAFYARGNGTPGPAGLVQAQSALCNAVLAYLRADGRLDGPIAAEVRRRAGVVLKHYEENKRAGSSAAKSSGLITTQVAGSNPAPPIEPADLRPGEPKV